ncbi:MAG: hypothetical protein APR55_01825 [Methanolinea sp. SDB]|nr:MAG: hypothetical protein APR55_01825 [Methanolinea sp. SDB]
MPCPCGQGGNLLRCHHIIPFDSSMFPGALLFVLCLSFFPGIIFTEYHIREWMFSIQHQQYQIRLPVEETTV